MGLFGIDAYNFLNPRGKETLQKSRGGFEQSCMLALGEILLRYPRCLSQIPLKNSAFRIRELPSLYNKTKTLIDNCSDLPDLASLCIKICFPYRLPAVGGAIESNPEEPFAFYPSKLDLDKHTKSYLILQAMYYKACNDNNASKSVTGVLRKLNGIDLETSKRIGKNFSSQKYTSKSKNQKGGNVGTLLNALISNKSTNNIYDFIISAGLLTSSSSGCNPYLYLYDYDDTIFSEVEEREIEDNWARNWFDEEGRLTYEDEFDDRIDRDVVDADDIGENGIPNDELRNPCLVTPSIPKKFFNRFFLKPLQFSKQNVEFKSITSYIVERISNVNLINYMYQLIRKELKGKAHSKYTIGKVFTLNHSSIKNIIYPITNYPLPNFRLQLLNFIYEPEDDDFAIIDKNFDNIRSSILFHTYYYFPLISRLFSLFLRMRIKNDPDFLLKYNLHRNICPIFLDDSAEPIYKFTTNYKVKYDTMHDKNLRNECNKIFNYLDPDYSDESFAISTKDSKGNTDNNEILAFLNLLDIDKNFAVRQKLFNERGGWTGKFYDYSHEYHDLQHYIYKLFYEEIINFDNYDCMSEDHSRVLFDESFFKKFNTFFPHLARKKSIINEILIKFPLFLSYDE